MSNLTSLPSTLIRNIRDLFKPKMIETNDTQSLEEIYKSNEALMRKLLDTTTKLNDELKTTPNWIDDWNKTATYANSIKNKPTMTHY